MFETMLLENFSQINIRHQIRDPGKAKNSKQDKCQNKQTKHSFWDIISKLQKIRDNEKIQRSPGRKYLTFEGAMIKIHPKSPYKTCKQEDSRGKYLKHLRKKH